MIEKNIQTYWAICQKCHGQGKKRRKLSIKARRVFKIERDIYIKTKGNKTAPTQPKGQLQLCLNCSGSGLIKSSSKPEADDKNYPHLAIIGGGISGVALAVACLHRKIPFTLYERDSSFNERSQGYGLTLQQASKAIQGFGIQKLTEGVVSTRHLVHTINGKVIGEWGMRKWMKTNVNPLLKRTNVHIARQALRLALLEQLGDKKAVHWGHQLIDFKENKKGSVDLNFRVNGKLISRKADIIVGADGIRSIVRKNIIREDVNPLRYLGCMVILGICPLKNIENINSDLLDSATVFQTANGNERIYMMPFSSNTIMWQLSFPIPENEAKKLSILGAKVLKKEAIKRAVWHDPIPQILKATLQEKISGYPVYDRELLDPELLKKNNTVTLIGDAAHPMSPFKGQGANQALLDSLALARAINLGCKPLSKWRTTGIRKTVLNAFELEMLERTAKKVKDSANAVVLLHSNNVLKEGNAPRGRE